MLRVIFDTNVYGKLILEEGAALIKNLILEDPEFVIYGFRPIRNELRDTPRGEHLGRLSKRNLLLALYDALTKGRYLKESIRVNQIALKFYNAYRQFGGIRSWRETNISVDFTIVACASIYSLDIVVSDDSSTLLSKPAIKAYKHVTAKEAICHPSFWKYSDLKKKYAF
jgi:hypothetical protein